VKTTVLLFALTVSAFGQQYGFNFRNTSTFVKDPAGDFAVLPSTAYPTVANGITFGWANTYLVQGRDRNSALDPRLAGINFAVNGYPASFYVDLAPGSYNLSLAIGDAGYQQCDLTCEIRFMDGATLLATLKFSSDQMASFYDAMGNNWDAAAWPGSNLSFPITLASTQLTMVVGSDTFTSYLVTPVAYLGIGGKNQVGFSLGSAYSVRQNGEASYIVSLAAHNNFNEAVMLSATNLPNGVTVTFSPKTIPAPGTGSSTMTIRAEAGVAVGFYPAIIMLGDSTNLVQTAPIPLMVTQ